MRQIPCWQRHLGPHPGIAPEASLTETQFESRFARRPITHRLRLATLRRTAAKNAAGRRVCAAACNVLRIWKQGTFGRKKNAMQFRRWVVPFRGGAKGAKAQVPQWEQRCEVGIAFRRNDRMLQWCDNEPLDKPNASNVPITGFLTPASRLITLRVQWRRAASRWWGVHLAKLLDVLGYAPVFDRELSSVNSNLNLTHVNC